LPVFFPGIILGDLSGTGQDLIDTIGCLPQIRWIRQDEHTQEYHFGISFDGIPLDDSTKIEKILRLKI
jgi:hypothetical protein